MLYITKKGTETTSAAICDECGAGYTWACNMSFSRIEYALRKKGWRLGKKHLCDECKPGRQAAAPKDRG